MQGPASISVLIPAYNEEDILEQSLLKVHAYLHERGWEHEVIMTSNGSTDRTVEIAQKLAAQNAWLRVLVLQERGVGKAFAAAANAARAEYLISLDIDLSSDLRFIDYAHDLLQYADAVIGSKTMGRQRRSPLRVVASQLYLLFSQLCFDLTISDYSIGAKAYRRSAVLPYLPHIDAWTGYVLELCLALHRAQKKIIQVGIDCDDRRASHFNLLHEGFYRYSHLVRCRLRLRQGSNWLAQVKG